MPTLSNSHLQSSFRAVTIFFVVAVVATLGGVLYLTSVRSVVSIIPTAKPTSQTLHLTIGPEGAGVDIPGTITVEKKSATATATPSATGSAVPAHAKGTVVLHNETSGAQPLATGTRLQSESGQIVRIVDHVTVPAHGTVSIGAVSDTEGTDGEIPPGRLTIVALRPANQAVVYGIVETAFTGGTTTQAGTLGVEQLTTASNTAEKQIASQFTSKPGEFISISPDQVAVTPAADVPSSQYQVNVTVNVITATYNKDVLQQHISQALSQSLADDESLITTAEPTLTFEQQPSTDRIIVKVEASGQVALRNDSPALQTSRMAGRPRSDVIQSLLGTGMIKSVDIRLQPFWRSNLPSDPAKIHVELQAAQLDAAAQ